MTQRQKLKFPEGFLWGAAGSAYQTEGGNANADWWQWERSGRREADLRSRGLNPADYRCGEACDSWNRFDEDFGLAKQLYHNATRFGLEWSRVEPKEGEFDEQALDQYEKMLRSAKFHGLKVFLTLHHFTAPVWFMKKGGFAKKSNLTHFFRYARRVANRLHEYVDFWLTVNEPEVYAVQSYLLGNFPPQVRSLRAALDVAGSLIEAHKLVASYIRERFRQPVSMAFHLSDLQPAGVLGQLAAGLADYFANAYVLRRAASSCDFIGVNYYFHHHVGIFGPRSSSGSNHATTDLGWGIHPEGIERVLLSVAKLGKPIYITENGLADSRDRQREQYIKDHLFYVHRAISRGADVRGYLYWSLLDNFEWTEGFWPRFGLIEIERETLLRRKIRFSALRYAEICRTNSLILES